MSWWRREPNLSPVHRYAQRVLRSHDATLRSRCFSRTPGKAAQHEDDDGSHRPAGMSNLEWMQLQHYKRWRKKLKDNPYQALFGASNDMLNGKGLKDWDWISRSFPRWMLREMDVPEDIEKNRYKGQEDHGNEIRPRKYGSGSSSAQSSMNERQTPTDSRYPKRVEIVNEDRDVSSQRQSHFAQPSYRTKALDRDDAFGVMSPSDLRRPREQPDIQNVGQTSKPDVLQSARMQDADASHDISSATIIAAPLPLKSTEPIRNPSAQENWKSNDDVSARESSFIEQFLADKPQHHKLYTKKQSKETSWRETALQRRMPGVPVVKPEIQLEPELCPNDEATKNNFVPKISPAEKHLNQASEATSRVGSVGEQSNSAKSVDWLVQQAPSSDQTQVRPEHAACPTRATSKILDQLPKEDIDFLTADAIRASMGTKKIRAPSDEEKQVKRQELEDTFNNTHKTNEEIDPMIESKVINDQLVRRIEREMREAQETQGPSVLSSAVQSSTDTLVSETQVESSIDRMKRWLDQGGAIFSNHFWQDPSEEADAKKTKLFFDKVVARIRKSRTAMKQVIEDLESDIPAARPLLKRMGDDESLLDATIHALRLRSGTGQPQALTPRKLKAIQALRLKFQDTERELNTAYALLGELGKTDAVKTVSEAFKRRLSIASQISHRSAHLSRYLIWSLQARLEDPDVDLSRLVHYKAVADSLLTLRDTQLALARLVDRAMLVYGVVPSFAESAGTMNQTYGSEDPTGCRNTTQNEESPKLNQVNRARIRANIAAEERLANEVEAQKTAMRGLSDDGYARMPKSTSRKAFDERSPLANSLFRPFGPVFESLGKDVSENAELRKVEEDAKKKANDAKLISEIRQAYEDTYGPITLQHRQVAGFAEEVEHEQDNVKSFEMLKEDPTQNSPTYTSVNSATDAEPAKNLDAAVVAQAEAPELPISTVSDVTSKDMGSPPAMWTVSEAANRFNAPTESISSFEDNRTSTKPDDPKLRPDEKLSNTANSLSTENLPTHYTILIHNTQTDTLSLTTSTTGPPRDTSPAIPMHQALSTLDAPAKFIPFITNGLEIVTAKKDMLVLRDALDSTNYPTCAFETVHTSPASSSTAFEDLDAERRQVNPIDGTARLSPTGYVGPEESQEQLEREFEERRQAADHINVENLQKAQQAQRGYSGKQRGEKDKKRGSASGVLKTAIWATVVCYVVGVFGEIATSPFKL